MNADLRLILRFKLKSQDQCLNRTLSPSGSTDKNVHVILLCESIEDRRSFYESAIGGGCCVGGVDAIK